MTMEGGCLCGKVRYTVSADPVFTGVCHCKNCQKGTGSAFSVVAGVPSQGLSISGEPKTYVGRGDSGQETRRRFCSECGSPITSEAAMMPGITMVEVGTLDDPSAMSGDRRVQEIGTQRSHARERPLLVETGKP